MHSFSFHFMKYLKNKYKCVIRIPGSENKVGQNVLENPGNNGFCSPCVVSIVATLKFYHSWFLVFCMQVQKEASEHQVCN